MTIIRKLVRLYRVWQFRRGMGKLAKAYGELTTQLDRLIFVTENFGKSFQDIGDSLERIDVTEQFKALEKKAK